MHRLLPFPKKKIGKKSYPRPSTLDPRQGEGEFVTQCNVTNYNVSESKAESYKTTHNFFVLEDGRSNSLLQTYKLLILQEI